MVDLHVESSTKKTKEKIQLELRQAAYHPSSSGVPIACLFVCRPVAEIESSDGYFRAPHVRWNEKQEASTTREGAV